MAFKQIHCKTTYNLVSLNCTLETLNAVPLQKRKRQYIGRTRPDTRPPVADGWAGAEMRSFPRFDSIITDGRANRRTDGPTDGRTKPLLELRVRT